MTGSLSPLGSAMLLAKFRKKRLLAGYGKKQ